MLVTPQLPPVRPRPADDRIITAIALGAGLLYAFGTSRIYTYADDSLPFVQYVHTGSRTIVHHLILNVLGELNRIFGFTGRHDFFKTLVLFKAYVGLSSVLALLLVGKLTFKWFGSRFTAVIAMLFVALSFGFWSYSIVPDVYVPAVAFVLLAVFLAERSCGARGLGVSWLALAALAILMASLNHQSHSLAALPLTGVLAFWKKGGLRWRQRMARALFFLALTGALGLATYYLFYLRVDPGTDFVTFVRGYQAWMKLMPTDRLQLQTPIYAGLGIARALLYPETALYFGSMYDSAQERFPFKLLEKNRYLIRDLPPAWIWAMLALIGLICVAMLVLAARAARNRHRMPGSPGFRMVLAWIPVQALFTAWWLASSREFWIWLVPCLALIGTGLVMPEKRNRWGRVVPLMFVGTLSIVNAPIISRYWSEENCFYWTNKEYLAELRPDDLAVTAYTYSIGELSLLFSMKAATFDSYAGRSDLDSTLFRRALERVRQVGGRIVLDPILVMPDDNELKRTRFYTGGERAATEEQLSRLETYCEEVGVPLLAVSREGGDIFHFHRCSFGACVKWTDEHLNEIRP